MKFKVCSILKLAAVLGASLNTWANLSIAAEEKTIIEPLDKQVLARNHNFGYSDDEIAKYFSKPLRLDLDDAGMNRSLLKAPPAAGVHPRILFNPEDIPDIRHRLQTTQAGQQVMSSIRKQIAKDLTGPKASLQDVYSALAAGDYSGVTQGGNGKDSIGIILTYECFRCLIDNDTAGGKKAAAAVATLAKWSQQQIDANIQKEKSKKNGVPNDFRVVAQGPTFEGTLGLMYDFSCNWMDPQQRDATRAIVAHACAGMTYIGCETLHGQITNSSNWIPWSSRMIFLCTAIEGEPGYDPLAYKRCVDAVTGNINQIYDSGECYEGWGKNFMFLEHAAIITRRGKNLLAAKKLRSVFDNFYIAAMNPWGHYFTFYDSLNGTGSSISRNADVMLFNYVFPNDPTVNFCYRNQILGGYQELTEANGINARHPFLATDALVCAIYANDIDTQNTWESDQARVTSNRPLTYFSQDTCNMITRSAWTKDALYMTYQNRAVRGGHLYSDRSHFNLYALGRYWAVYQRLRQENDHAKPENRSTVMIDGLGSSVAPGKCVAFEDQPQASFIATDLKVAWDYVSNGIYPAKDRNKIVKLPFDSNYFRLTPSDDPQLSIPIDDMPNWLTSQKPEPLPARPPAGEFWTRREPGIDHAYRTAGLIRGKHPYALVIDDIQQDQAEHDYTWNLTIANDVALGDAKTAGSADHPTAELVLNDAAKESADPTRHLLLKIVDAAQLDPQPATVETITLANTNQKPFIFPKLVVHSRCVAPHFKTLLIPYRDGEALPTTSWNADHNQLTVAWEDQHDTITFKPNADGRSRVTILRASQALLDLH